MDRSTPTSPEFDVSAALEDAEGRALVEKIHDPANPRLAHNQGRDVWDYYASVPAPTYDPFKESRRLYVGGRGYGKTDMSKEWVELGAATTVRFDEMPPDLPKMMPTPLPASVETTIENVSEEFYRLLFGATRAELQEMVRKQNELEDLVAGWRAAPPRPAVPAVGTVRWNSGPRAAVPHSPYQFGLVEDDNLWNPNILEMLIKAKGLTR